MRCVGHETPLPLLGTLERTEHIVQRIGEVSDLVLRLRLWEAERRVAASSDRRGCLREESERTKRTTEEDRSGKRGEGRGDDSTEAEDVAETIERPLEFARRRR